MPIGARFRAGARRRRASPHPSGFPGDEPSLLDARPRVRRLLDRSTDFRRTPQRYRRSSRPGRRGSDRGAPRGASPRHRISARTRADDKDPGTPSPHGVMHSAESRGFAHRILLLLIYELFPIIAVFQLGSKLWVSSAAILNGLEALAKPPRVGGFERPVIFEKVATRQGFGVGMLGLRNTTAQRTGTAPTTSLRDSPSAHWRAIQGRVAAVSRRRHRSADAFAQATRGRAGDGPCRARRGSPPRAARPSLGRTRRPGAGLRGQGGVQPAHDAHVDRAPAG